MQLVYTDAAILEWVHDETERLTGVLSGFRLTWEKAGEPELCLVLYSQTVHKKQYEEPYRFGEGLILGSVTMVTEDAEEELAEVKTEGERLFSRLVREIPGLKNDLAKTW